MRQYLELLHDILDNGVLKSDRTGTGTISVFGRMMRFDLSEGLPLLTTKKVHFKSIAEELFWMMRGETNTNTLNATIWDEWSNEDGELGPVYGHSWRQYGKKPDCVIPPKPNLPERAEYCGVADGSGSYNHPIGKVWQGMIQRCYSKIDIGYDNYGRRGVHVCDRWLTFDNFAEDYQSLPGWKEDSYERVTLDKDGRGNGFLYSPGHCQWVTDQQNILLRSNKIYTLEKEGVLYKFRNPSEFCKQQDIPNNNISDLWTGRKNAEVRHGFRLVNVKDANPGVDQLQNCLNMLRTNPNDRRMLVCAWNPGWTQYMALPPCHLLFQFYVAKGRLSCQVYQRSCDVFLGVPFNIASYALLIHLMAQMANLKPGELIWVGGDTHLYLNHMKQVETQLARSPHNLPTLHVNWRGGGLDDWKIDDIVLSDYNCHPAIKAPVSV